MTERIEMWRCRRCGKWSHAKRRPASHQAVKVIEEEQGVYRKSTMVYCGPFDRFVASPDDPDSPPDNPDFFGRPIFGTELEWHADPNAGIVPW